MERDADGQSPVRDEIKSKSGLWQNRAVPVVRPPARMEVGELLIRRWRLSDVDPLRLAVAESLDELRPWLIWANGDTGEQAAFLEASVAGWEQGDRFEYGVENPRGQLVAGMGLMRRIGPGGLELGYWVHSAHTGCGIAKLAAARLTAAALELPDIDHVQIHHDRANRRSGAVPAALGFELIEEIAKDTLAPSDTGRDLVWRMRREDFSTSPARILLESADRAGR